MSFRRTAPTAALALTLLAAGQSLPAQQAGAPLTDGELATHILNRLAFGARPGDREAVLAMGVDAWIERQLHPETIPDSAARRALAQNGPWRAAQEGTRYTRPVSPMIASFDTAGIRRRAERTTNEIPMGLVFRAEASETQLLEVMTNFWENHFSIFAGRVGVGAGIMAWDRETIRPRALGRFRDLLGAVAHSAQMLVYLDNYASSVAPEHRSLIDYRRMIAGDTIRARRDTLGLNENYAREILELHTLGVDGGYTQADVIAIARALTGWTVPLAFGLPFPVGPFTFVDAMHDADEKTVLGHILPAGRGVQDGEDVLDIIARHPSTARFIAKKLVVRFVSDVPPEPLVERAAATFTRTDGDIREVVRTIVTSPEFRDRSALRSKVKNPFEFVVSLRRALAVPLDTTYEAATLMARLGQPIFGREAPDGWPETGAPWLTAGAMFLRTDIAARFANEELYSFSMRNWAPWPTLRTLPFEEQVNVVVRELLGGVVSPNTRAVLEQARPTMQGEMIFFDGDGEAPIDSEVDAAARELVVLALSSPEFQRR